MLQENENLCKRCKISPKAPPRITASGRVIPRERCEDCLAYARDWQRKNTAARLAAGKCITCGKPTVASRCEKCTSLKAQNYFDTRSTIN